MKNPESKVVKQFFDSSEIFLEQILFNVYPDEKGLKAVSVKFNECLHLA